jgi:uncharacterized protein YacL
MNPTLELIIMIPIVIILWAMAGVVVGLVVAILIDTFRPKKQTSVPCPHGHEDWGDCPDCSH